MHEPLAWCIIPFAPKLVLAGDHLQLPPTVISQEAARMGLNQSILEKAVTTFADVYMLNTQYRMREAIAGFSSGYFYNGLLRTASHLGNTGVHISFIDTAGTGYHETSGGNGNSLQNGGELGIAQKLLETESLDVRTTAFISPYAGQVAAAIEQLPEKCALAR